MTYSAKKVNEPGVLFWDAELLAVYKPLGWRTSPDVTGRENLLHWAKRWVQQVEKRQKAPFLAQVHRLDTRVEGVVLFARTSRSAAHLSQQFREGRVKKEYLALVGKAPHPPSGTLEGWLKKVRGRQGEWRALVSSKPNRGYKWASLSYRLLERRKDWALLEVFPKTGRFHQIRALLAYAGCPILGDNKYGGAAFPLAGGIGLQCHKLTLEHPSQGKVVEISSFYPPHWPPSSKKV